MRYLSPVSAVFPIGITKSLASTPLKTRPDKGLSMKPAKFQTGLSTKSSQETQGNINVALDEWEIFLRGFDPRHGSSTHCLNASL
jgi:hypothetical protein